MTLILRLGKSSGASRLTAAGPVLNLMRVKRKQMGSYLCIASNSVPPAVSKRITLRYF